MAKTLDDYISEITQLADGRDLSMRWYRDQVRAIVPRTMSEAATGRLVRGGDKKSRPIYGVLNLYGYEPKHKLTLEYYDVFPLVIPIERYKNGFLGINLHYLSINVRMKLLEKLMPMTAENRVIGWRRVSRFPQVKPCVKKYLAAFTRTQFLPIVTEEEMNLAALMPLQQFRKASREKVWYDSRRMIA